MQELLTLGPFDWPLSWRNSPVFHSAGTVNPIEKLSNLRELRSESAQSNMPIICSLFSDVLLLDEKNASLHQYINDMNTMTLVLWRYLLYLMQDAVFLEQKQHLTEFSAAAGAVIWWINPDHVNWWRQMSFSCPNLVLRSHEYSDLNQEKCHLWFDV